MTAARGDDRPVTAAELYDVLDGFNRVLATALAELADNVNKETYRQFTLQSAWLKEMFQWVATS